MSAIYKFATSWARWVYHSTSHPHMNHHLPVGISYLLVDLYQLPRATKFQTTNLILEHAYGGAAVIDIPLWKGFYPSIVGEFCLKTQHLL